LEIRSSLVGRKVGFHLRDSTPTGILCEWVIGNLLPRRDFLFQTEEKITLSANIFNSLYSEKSWGNQQR
jgi:hypothetical protein